MIYHHQFNVKNVTVYMCDIHEIKKHTQLKAILAFTIESLYNWFLIHHIYTIHAIVTKVDDVRTRNDFWSDLWILSCVHQYIAQAHLKTLLEMIHSSNQLFYGLWLMAFIYLALFCVVEKVIVL